MASVQTTFCETCCGVKLACVELRAIVTTVYVRQRNTETPIYFPGTNLARGIRESQVHRTVP